MRQQTTCSLCSHTTPVLAGDAEWPSAKQSSTASSACEPGRCSKPKMILLFLGEEQEGKGQKCIPSSRNDHCMFLTCKSLGWRKFSELRFRHSNWETFDESIYPSSHIFLPIIIFFLNLKGLWLYDKTTKALFQRKYGIVLAMPKNIQLQHFWNKAFGLQPFKNAFFFFF